MVDFTPKIPPRLQALFDRIGYEFQDIDLVKRALTHGSYGDGRRETVDNERLEFLGDRVLGLLTAKTLFDSTSTKEGVMATRLNALVRKETCAQIARDINLGDVLLLSPSEDKQGGRNKTSILGDACEALLGAIYLDGGLDAAEQFYEAHWQSDLTKVLNEGTKDPKTKLQEFALARGQSIPFYEVTERSGPDHKPSFTITVKVDGLGVASGTGKSKKEAERSAAKILLEQVTN